MEPISLNPGFILPVASLWWRELVRFYRQRSRVVGALGTPLVFWLLIGSGFGSSFRQPSTEAGMGYLEYFFPGTVMMVLLFSSIFSSISVIEERADGFLLSVLVAPISRLSLVLGKVLGGTTMALLQAALFLLLAPAVKISLSFWQLILLLAVFFLISFALNSLGFVFAWRLDSIQGFHAIMNLLLVPMWVLSGALFPPSGASTWVRWIMRINPLTYGMTALRRSFYWKIGKMSSESGSLTVSLGITCFFGLVMIATACYLAQRQPLKG